METKAKNTALKVVVAAAFLAMIAVNYLAQSLPINGVTPGQVSDSLPNLFAPAGLTFSIWGLIYLALAAFTVYQFGPIKQARDAASLDKVRVLFVLSSLANIAWIFSWHYGNIPLSMLLMLAILVCLILINRTLDQKNLTRAEKLVVRLPFRLYFGWITVATVANATALLVSVGWDRFGLAEQVWTVAILLVAMLIGAATMISRKDIPYGLVLVWAYAGILIKHTSSAGFAGSYTAVIATLIACLAVFAAAEAYIIQKVVKNSGA